MLHSLVFVHRWCMAISYVDNLFVKVTWNLHVLFSSLFVKVYYMQGSLWDNYSKCCSFVFFAFEIDRAIH